MELNEAVRRIVGQHWLLIILVAFVPFEVVAVLHSFDSPSYTASGRVVLDTPDPKSGPESAAIADTAKAIVTSPSEVAHTLRQVGASGLDPVDFAKKNVQVRALGSSGVLELSVTAPSPRSAAAITNALANRLIATRLKLTRGEVQETLAGLDRRIDRINRKISRLDIEADGLVVAAAGSTEPERVNALRGQRDEARRARDFLAQERAVRESERVSLISTLAVRPQPSIISAARPPVHADPSGQLADLVLAGLLGLVLGVGLAGLKETLRPTLVGAEAVASELDAPLLGTVRGRTAAAASSDERSRIAGRLRMSAEQARVRSVTLVATGDDATLEPLSRALSESLVGPPPEVDDSLAGDGEAARVASGPRPSTVAVREPRATAAVPIRVFGTDDHGVHNGGATGLVVVAPNLLKRGQLAETKQLLRISPAPLLGVIACEQPRAGKGLLRRFDMPFGRRNGSS